jgi:hypothetical protein
MKLNVVCQLALRNTHSIELKFVAVLLISGVLELASWLTWHAYVGADAVRDRFEQWWRAFRRELPSWWERPET